MTILVTGGTGGFGLETARWLVDNGARSLVLAARSRTLTGVMAGPLIGSIIKPNVGLSAAETADLVRRLCETGLDFIKDDEISADPDYAPLAQRIPAVMFTLSPAP